MGGKTLCGTISSQSTAMPPSPVCCGMPAHGHSSSQAALNLAEGLPRLLRGLTLDQASTRDVTGLEGVAPVGRAGSSGPGAGAGDLEPELAEFDRQVAEAGAAEPQPSGATDTRDVPPSYKVRWGEGRSTGGFRPTSCAASRESARHSHCCQVLREVQASSRRGTAVPTACTWPCCAHVCDSCCMERATPAVALSQHCRPCQPCDH
jgi:hypothetical protein